MSDADTIALGVVAEDVREIKDTVAGIAASQTAAAIAQAVLDQKTRVADARIKALENNQRWLVLLIVAAVAETALRQTGLLT